MGIAGANIADLFFIVDHFLFEEKSPIHSWPKKVTIHCKILNSYYSNATSEFLNHHKYIEDLHSNPFMCEVTCQVNCTGIFEKTTDNRI